MTEEVASQYPDVSEPRRNRLGLIGGVLAIAIVALVVAAVLSRDGDDANLPASMQGAASVDGPCLAVDQTVIDHGAVPYGHTVEAEYLLKNVGDAPLRIEEPEFQILDGCCPSKPVVGKTTLQPGETTTVSIMFRMQEGTGGPHKFEIIVPTNDAVDPTMSLIVAATYPLP